MVLLYPPNSSVHSGTAVLAVASSVLHYKVAVDCLGFSRESLRVKSGFVQSGFQKNTCSENTTLGKFNTGEQATGRNRRKA